MVKWLNVSTFYLCVSYPQRVIVPLLFSIVVQSSSLHLQRVAAFEHNTADASRAAGVGTVLGQRRTILYRHWLDVSCLLGRFWACAGAVLGHCRRRLASFGPTLGQGFFLLEPL